MPDLVIDGITIRSHVFNVATGETKPFDECKEDFLRHYIAQSQVIMLPEGETTRINDKHDAEWYAILNNDGTRISKVLKKGEPEYERIRESLLRGYGGVSDCLRI